jgi:hypothetical protein
LAEEEEAEVAMSHRAQRLGPFPAKAKMRRDLGKVEAQ